MTFCRVTRCSCVTDEVETTVPVFAPVLARLFVTLPPPHSSRSHGLPIRLRDGTDRLLGGLPAAPGVRQALATTSGGAS
jgi:hypothetical protein